MTISLENRPTLESFNTIDVFEKALTDRACIFLKCTGVLTKSNAQVAVLKMKSLMHYEPDQKAIIIWNCMGLHSYNEDAIKLLQDFLSESKESIEGLWVITESLEVHAAVEIISFFSATKIRVVNSITQLENKINTNRA